MADGPIISDEGRKHLRLTLCPEVGPIRFANLLNELGGIDAVLGASVARLQSVTQVGPKVAESIARTRERADVEGEIETACRANVCILCLADEKYPAVLRRINDPPPCLYVRGNLERRDVAALAIVGSRGCSRYGAEQAERFGALAANAGMTVVSGMARGVDHFAHVGALAAGGRTLAVQGCGLSHVYPPDAADLAVRICNQGALLSELPMHVAPDAKNFPPRNRIIAGLSLGVLVVEAARRSGALITARLASEYNREVFALAGRVDTPQAEGCLELVKAGAAKLVTRFDDILEELGEAGELLRQAAAPRPPAEMRAEEANDSPRRPPSSDSQRPLVVLDEVEERVVLGMAGESLSIDDLCEVTGLSPSRVAVALTGLQLKGIVRRLPGERFERTGKR